MNFSVLILLFLILVGISLLIFLNIKKYNETVEKIIENNFKDINTQISIFNNSQEKIEKTLREEMSLNRRELNENLKNVTDTLLSMVNNLTQSVENKLNKIQKDNEDKLEKIRETVDEKLHITLEKRLGESFKLVTEYLENVAKGIGEMQTLAEDVGDLKKVLTNVKARGIWGEVQLGVILEDMLSPEQYEKNVKTNSKKNEYIEYAIKLPGNKNDKKPVWLPVDSKFPKEDYERLIFAQEKGNKDEVAKNLKALINRIKTEAKDIKEKYINPPETTDFAIMFLPTEGLYAEVLRVPGVITQIQREYRVVIAGPTTFSALLNSLQMGFRTLAVQKRSVEVWQLLNVVREEFVKFGEILEKTQQRMRQASDEIDRATKKTRTIEKKLKKVQEIPIENTTSISKLLDEE